MLYSKEPVHCNDVGINRRNHNFSCCPNSNPKKKYATDLNIEDRISKFKNLLKNEHVNRIPLKFLEKLVSPPRLVSELNATLKLKSGNCLSLEKFILLVQHFQP